MDKHYLEAAWINWIDSLFTIGEPIQYGTTKAYELSLEVYDESVNLTRGRFWSFEGIDFRNECCLAAQIALEKAGLA